MCANFCRCAIKRGVALFGNLDLHAYTDGWLQVTLTHCHSHILILVPTGLHVRSEGAIDDECPDGYEVHTIEQTTGTIPVALNGTEVLLERLLDQVTCVVHKCILVLERCHTQVSVGGTMPCVGIQRGIISRPN